VQSKRHTVSLGRDTVTGTLASEGLEGLLPAEKLAELKRAGKGAHRFVTARVEDAGLVPELEAAGVPFTGRVENTWFSLLLRDE
jgi:cell division protease FtsH